MLSLLIRCMQINNVMKGKKKIHKCQSRYETFWCDSEFIAIENLHAWRRWQALRWSLTTHKTLMNLVMLLREQIQNIVNEVQHVGCQSKWCATCHVSYRQLEHIHFWLWDSDKIRIIGIILVILLQLLTLK